MYLLKKPTLSKSFQGVMMEIKFSLPLWSLTGIQGRNI